MTDNENKPAAAPAWCGVCGKPMDQVSGWCDKPGICPHGQIAQLRKAREATEKPKASAVPEPKSEPDDHGLNIDEERLAFEASGICGELEREPNGFYSSYDTNCAWCGWMARARLEKPE